MTVVVRPQRADVLCQRLLSSGLVEGMSARECRGYGRQKGHLERYRGNEYDVEFLPKVLISGIIASEQRQAVVELVLATSRTGRIGDGKIFFQDVIDELDF